MSKQQQGIQFYHAKGCQERLLGKHLLLQLLPFTWAIVNALDHHILQLDAKLGQQRDCIRQASFFKRHGLATQKVTGGHHPEAKCRMMAGYCKRTMVARTAS